MESHTPTAPNTPAELESESFFVVPKLGSNLSQRHTLDNNVLKCWIALWIVLSVRLRLKRRIVLAEVDAACSSGEISHTRADACYTAGHAPDAGHQRRSDNPHGASDLLYDHGR